MYHLRLIKSLSYTGVLKATKDNPDIFIDDEAIVEKAIKTGYFKLIEDKDCLDYEKSIESKDNENQNSKEYKKIFGELNRAELETFAIYNNINIKGITKKADIIEKLKIELGISEDDKIELKSPTMTEL